MDPACNYLESGGGDKLSEYEDSVGLKTIGIGYNLEQSKAKAKATACGGNCAAAMGG